eukprot:4877781-Pyramimonas_sp.AAC.1
MTRLTRELHADGPQVRAEIGRPDVTLVLALAPLAGAPPVARWWPSIAAAVASAGSSDGSGQGAVRVEVVAAFAADAAGRGGEAKADLAARMAIAGTAVITTTSLCRRAMPSTSAFAEWHHRLPE